MCFLSLEGGTIMCFLSIRLMVGLVFKLGSGLGLGLRFRGQRI